MPGPAPAMIDVRDLRYTYARSNVAAVSGLDFSVNRGEIFGFLGPSGAGKSTTQKILVGLLDGYEGQARVLGREVRTWTAGEYERIGVSFETPTTSSSSPVSRTCSISQRCIAVRPAPLRRCLNRSGSRTTATDA